MVPYKLFDWLMFFFATLGCLHGCIRIHHVNNALRRVYREVATASTFDITNVVLE